MSTARSPAGAHGNAIVLQPCATASTPVVLQQWVTAPAGNFSAPFSVKLAGEKPIECAHWKGPCQCVNIAHMSTLAELWACTSGDHTREQWEFSQSDGTIRLAAGQAGAGQCLTVIS
jgi:hypothetical protein